MWPLKSVLGSQHISYYWPLKSVLGSQHVSYYWPLKSVLGSQQGSIGWLWEVVGYGRHAGRLLLNSSTRHAPPTWRAMPTSVVSPHDVCTLRNGMMGALGADLRQDRRSFITRPLQLRLQATRHNYVPYVSWGSLISLDIVWGLRLFSREVWFYFEPRGLVLFLVERFVSSLAQHHQ